MNDIQKKFRKEYTQAREEQEEKTGYYFSIYKREKVDYSVRFHWFVKFMLFILASVIIFCVVYNAMWIL